MHVTVRAVAHPPPPAHPGEGDGDGGGARAPQPSQPGAVVGVVEVSGEVDLHTGPRLRAVLLDVLAGRADRGVSRAPGREEVAVGGALGEALAPRERDSAGSEVVAVVVDLREVTFLDSYALGVLVHAAKLARSGGRGYALVSASANTAKLFQITGLDRVMSLHKDLPSALVHLQRHEQPVEPV